MHFDTLAVHAAAEVDPTTGAVAPAIHPSTTFERAADGSFPSGFNYVRSGNPNRASLESALAALEGGGEAVTFASGTAATNAVLQALAPGDHVIAPLDAYYGTPKLLREHFARWGLEFTFVDMTRPAAVRAALQPNTRLLWAESPSNPLITISDLSSLATLATAAGLVSVCDNTWATPFLQRPLELGFRLAMHSTTKYLGGHGDVMGGAVIGASGDPFIARLRAVQVDAGAVPSPLDCWLVLRGIRSLPCRMRAHCAGAAALAARLARHPRVERVHYPGLSEDPGHALASRQMRLYGGMLSVVVPGGRAAAYEVAGRLQIFTRATSLGGPESLVEHRASIEGPATRAPEGLLRLSVGLEHPDDLIADFERALGP